MTTQAGNNNGPPLRIGLLLDSYTVEAWQHRMIERIVASHYATISLLVVNGAPQPASSPLDKLWQKRSRIGYFVLNKIDQSLFKPAHDPFVKADLSPLLAQVPSLIVVPTQTQFVDRFSAEDVATIRAHRIDVLVRLGFRILKGEILRAARYGVWSFHHGDNQINRGGPPGFWESVQNWDVTGSILQILAEELDGGQVLHRSWSTTNRFSPTLNRCGFYWKTLAFLPRKLEELHRNGPDAFFAAPRRENQEVQIYPRPLYTTPSNLRTAGLALKQAGKIGYRTVQRTLFHDQWILLYCRGATMATNLRRFQKLIPPRDRFWADPFVIRRGDSHYIFLEELPFATNKGHISVIRLHRDGRADPPIKVLERPFHLSYPFLFETEGKLYMIPDTLANRTIELYECVEFPLRWEHRANLMENVDAVDVTLLRREGKWWLFCAMIEHPGAATEDELFLFYADDLFSGRWTAHARNPIVSDVRRARPAGQLFELNGELFRPSQNSARYYGYGFNINKVVTLSATAYAETLVTAVKPEWDPRIRGTHTYNFADGLTVIDGLTYRNRYWG